MVDAIFEHPRLVAIYDALDADRRDLLPYRDMVEEFGARSVVDVGCGTGTFALLLAAGGVSVTGVDPAAGSLAVARAKPGADRVRWVHGDATALPPLRADLVTMTGNVAQAIHEPAAWHGTLRAIRSMLDAGGVLAFETRDPADRAWRRWNRADTHRVTEIPGVGRVTTWEDLTGVDGPLVNFRSNWVFAADGAWLTSDSTLRFRERDEVVADLSAAGFTGTAVRDAPDRPGREFVFVARADPEPAGDPAAATMGRC